MNAPSNIHTQLDQTLQLVQNFMRMAWRFRWPALVVATLMSFAGWAWVSVQPNLYEVSARVFLDTQSMLRPLLRGLAVDSRSAQDTALLASRTLLLRPNLEEVARKTDMDLRATTPREFEQLLDDLRGSIRVSGTDRDNIFRISYRSEDPREAYRVVEALLNIYVEKSLGDARKDSSTSQQFIEAQIREYEGRLLAAENRLKEFRRQNVGTMPTDGRGYYSRLQSMQAQLAEARLQLEEAQRKIAALSEQLEEVPPSISQQAAAQQHQSPLGSRVLAMEQRLDELLLQYTSRHPDVVAIRGTLEVLRAQLEAEQQAETDGAAQGGPGAIPNPLHQQLSLQLGAAEAEAAALTARVTEFERRETELAKLVDTIPQVEAELTRLNRDYEIDRNNYDQLVKRREQLRISEDASQTTDDVRINIIEPPREPLTPVAPNRVKLSAGVLIAALGLGGGLAFLLGLLKPAFYTREDFEAATGLPVLGLVSRIWTRRELFRRKIEVATFAMGCLALVGLFGAVIAAHTIYLEQVLALDLPGRLEELDLPARLSALKARLL